MFVDFLFQTYGPVFADKLRYVEDNHLINKAYVLYAALPKFSKKGAFPCLVLDPLNNTSLSDGFSNFTTLCGQSTTKLKEEVLLCELAADDFCIQCCNKISYNSFAEEQYLEWLELLVKLDYYFSIAELSLEVFSKEGKLFSLSDAVIVPACSSETISALCVVDMLSLVGQLVNHEFWLKGKTKSLGLWHSKATDEYVQSYVLKAKATMQKLRSSLCLKEALESAFETFLRTFSLQVDDLDFPYEIIGTQRSSLLPLLGIWLESRRLVGKAAANAAFELAFFEDYFFNAAFLPKKAAFNPSDFADFDEYLKAELFYNSKVLFKKMLVCLETAYLNKSSFAWASQRVYYIKEASWFESPNRHLLLEDTAVGGIGIVPKMLADNCVVLGLVSKEDTVDVLRLAYALFDGSNEKLVLEAARTTLLP